MNKKPSLLSFINFEATLTNCITHIYSAVSNKITRPEHVTGIQAQGLPNRMYTRVNEDGKLIYLKSSTPTLVYGSAVGKNYKDISIFVDYFDGDDWKY